jgi:hypothetical protein
MSQVYAANRSSLQPPSNLATGRPQVGPYSRHLEQLKMALLEQCRAQKLEPPAADRIEQLVPLPSTPVTKGYAR